MSFRQKIFSLAVALSAAAAVSFASSEAHAQERSIIRNPGDHPNYVVEAEPHLLVGVWDPWYRGTTFGLGGRFSFPIVKNGFVSTINNNVAIGVGLDWLHGSGCGYYGPGYVGNCDAYNSFWIPVVMQWNFFLSTHWSVFGEPGLGIVFDDYNHDYCDRFYNGRGGYCSSRSPITPVLFVGGRYHFSQSVAMTMRIGFPYLSFGVSFM